MWSRSRKRIAGVAFFAGPDELPAFLSGCDILVCLLPLTRDTRGKLNASVFAALPAGAVVINVSRGGNLIQDDLIAALDGGHLSAAILDVCEPEPLPGNSPLWRHPKILLTPHIATKTQAETAADIVIANLERHRRGEPMEHLVDRRRGDSAIKNASQLESPVATNCSGSSKTSEIRPPRSFAVLLE